MSVWRRDFETVIRPALNRSKYLQGVAVDQDIIKCTGQLVRTHFENKSAKIFADEAGFSAAGQAVIASLKSVGISVETHIIPAKPRPKPSVELARTFESLITPTTIPISLGSGVMNDLVKYAAFQKNMPYCAIATAASMDGYASAGSPLSRDGFKITIPTSCPRLIIADLDIIAAAPSEMVGWGYGDLAGKIPAGGDWLIADAFDIETIDEIAWPLVQNNLKSWLANPKAVLAGDFDAIAHLFMGLTVAGLAMEFHGSSRPASGADHQIAHMWEMEDLKYQGERVSHGACVSVGCVTALQLFDWLLEQNLEQLNIDHIIENTANLDAKFAEIDTLIANPQIIERARIETEKKHLSHEELRVRLDLIQKRWPQLKNRLEQHLIRAYDVIELLKSAGSPVTASDIGVSKEHHRKTVQASRFIRSRYTILDLLDEVGLFNTAIDTLFTK